MLKITNSSDYNLLNSKNIIIVPETFSHNYERYLCEKYSNNISMSTEILTFTRISDRIFAEIGGFASNYINDSGRILAMFNAINCVHNELKIYKSNKIEIITKLLAIIDEFKIYKITEEQLLLASENLEGTLKNKILDLYFIYSQYNKITCSDILDPRDELEFLCENFKNSTIYDDFNVYFDKFDGFTPQQYSLITEFLKKGINITITLDIKEQNDKLYDLTKTSRDTLEHLKKICKKNDFDYQVESIPSNNSKFFDICENLFEYSECNIKNDDIKLHISTTIQNECLYTAGKVLDLVSSDDFRYKDILITARNFDLYKSHLEVAFERFSIPLFSSSKSDIMTKVPITYILGVLEAISSNFKCENVFKLLKSPLAYIDDISVYKIEDYCIRWDIKYLSSDVVFTSNPLFKLRKVDDSTQDLLDYLNKQKDLGLIPIYRLKDSFSKCKNGQDFINVLYSFCVDTNLDNAIIYYETEDINLKQEYSQLWDILVDSFDQFVEISGTQSMDLDEFVKLYKTLICSYEVASIPASLDSVNSGQFDRIIGEKCKVLFVLGADDDNLPAKITQNAILNDDDRDILECEDIIMSPYGNELVNREFELIYKTFNLPSNKLFVSFCEVCGSSNSPSSIFKRIKQIVDNIEITTDSLKEFDFMFKSKKTALEQFAIINDTAKIAEINESLLKPMDKMVISKETLDKIYAKSLSPSKIDMFNSCRFRFFMQYGLKIDPRRVIKFDRMENGNFIHFILENILKNKDYSQDNIGTYVEDYINEYANEYFAKNLIFDVKFRYILDNLKKNTQHIVCNIIDEINASNFKPTDFEIEISNTTIIKPIKINNFNIIGKIDRIDIYDQDEQQFLRIIDYKSGVKKLDLSTFHYGINMQMFIYMLAVESLQADSVGALYIPTKMPKISSSKPLLGIERKNKIAQDLKRSGMILKDEHIVRNMEKNNPFLYLPVKFTKSNDFDKRSSSVASRFRIDATKNFVLKKLSETILAINSGETAPNPYIYDDKSPCDYCKYISCCGFCDSYDKKRIFKNLKTDEFWESIGVLGDEFE